MPDSEEKLDEAAAIERLNGALELQYHSALQYSIVAASLRGLEAQAVGSTLTRFGDAIEPTGREGRSEALEHLMEHLILRKQEQVDFLERAAG
jgi:hypothetical protein